MRKTILYTLLLLIAFHAFGHAGEVHSYMGTVVALRGEGFTLRKTDGVTLAVELSGSTTYLRADGRAATRADLAAGRRVVVTIGTDGRTATTIKIAAPK